MKTFEDWQEECPWADHEEDWVEEQKQYMRTGDIFCTAMSEKECEEWDCAIWKFKEFLEEK